MGKYRIMTFDGGGVRGSLMAALVKRLTDTFPGMLDQVDLFAGTSTGSVVALGLASGINADTLVDFYSQENLRSAFSPSRRNWLRPRYANSNFKNLLENHFPGNQTLRDLTRHHVMVTSFQLNDHAENHWYPHFIHNYTDDPNSPYLNDLVVDCALRSAAAPTVFPSHQGYIDGGMIANNPSTPAIAVALRHEPNLNLSDISLLSLGTGLTPTILEADSTRWGVIQWMLNPFRLPAEPLLNILFDGVVNADHFMSKQLLRERYCRLNPPLRKPTALDDWKAIPQLIETANDFDLGPTIEWVKNNWY
jgi:patatin-like phospholipase/acyl hydrolase